MLCSRVVKESMVEKRSIGVGLARLRVAATMPSVVFRVENLEGLVSGFFYNGGWKTNRHHRNGQVAILVWRRSRSEGRQNGRASGVDRV